MEERSEKQDSDFRGSLLQVMTVMVAARMSLTGSARKTAKTGSGRMCGRMKMSGMRRISFRRQASSRQTLACPSAMKLCWQAIWKPMAKKPAI